MRPRTTILVVMLPLLLLAAAPMALSVTRPTLQEVTEGLTCQCGCGLTVANCNHPTCNFAVPLRTELEAMIGRGQGRSQILASFRAKYGEKILSAPTTEGFNILAWTMPFVALLGGAALIVLAIGRWQRPPEGSPTPASGEGAASESQARLRRELEKEVGRRL